MTRGGTLTGGMTGTRSFPPHCGQFPFFPENREATRIVAAQRGHWNFIRAATAGGGGGGGAGGGGGGCDRRNTELGLATGAQTLLVGCRIRTRISAWQRGH